jgi:hypothetical protein
MNRTDTFISGVIAGLAIPFLFYFILEGVSLFLQENVLEDWYGFSERFKIIIAVASNFMPFQVFVKQERGHSMQGLITMTFVLMFSAVYYFRADFF